MKKIVSILCVVLLVGCRAHPVRIQPEYSVQTFPAIGAIVTAGIGEQLVTQGDAMTVDALVLSSDVNIRDILVRKGRYPLVSENDKFREFGSVIMSKAGVLLKRANVYIFKPIDSAGGICISHKACADIAYEIGKMTTYSPSTRQYTLLYSGKIGNRITLGYREFTNEIARPAFSNDVSYDLSESTILGYKGARLEVLSATNTEITYKILAGFK